MYKFLCGCFISLGAIPRRGISGSHGNSIFSVLRNGQTIFQSGCTIVHAHQQCIQCKMSLEHLVTTESKEVLKKKDKNKIVGKSSSQGTNLRAPNRQTWKTLINKIKKYGTEGLSGVSVVKNPPANAGDTSLIPTREDPTCRRVTKSMSHNYGCPHILESMLPNKRSHRNEKPMPLLAATRE